MGPFNKYIMNYDTTNFVHKNNLNAKLTELLSNLNVINPINHSGTIQTSILHSLFVGTEFLALSIMSLIKIKLELLSQKEMINKTCLLIIYVQGTRHILSNQPNYHEGERSSSRQEG